MRTVDREVVSVRERVSLIVVRDRESESLIVVDRARHVCDAEDRFDCLWGSHIDRQAGNSA